MVDTVRTASALTTILADNTTGNITPQNVRDLMVTAFNFAAPIRGDIATPTNRTVYLDINATEAYTINSLVTKLSAGTCTVAIQIGGVNVTGLSAVSVTTAKSTATATGNNTVAIGNDVTMVVSGVASAAGFALKLNRTRL